MKRDYLIVCLYEMYVPAAVIVSVCLCKKDSARLAVPSAHVANNNRLCFIHPIAGLPLHCIFSYFHAPYMQCIQLVCKIVFSCIYKCINLHVRSTIACSSGIAMLSIQLAQPVGLPW